MRPGRLGNVRSFAVYYGSGGEDRLSAYDLVVLDPGGHTCDGIRLIKDADTLALAYLSVLEIPADAVLPAPECALRVAGNPVYGMRPGSARRHGAMHRGGHRGDGSPGNLILDPRAPETTQRALDVAQRALADGYDGLFLDTLADLEDLPLDDTLAAAAIPAAAGLVAELSRRCGRLLVQNRGAGRLLPLTAPYLDGFCWEAFPYARIGPQPRAHSGVVALQKLQSDGLKVLALNEGVAAAAARAARQAAARCDFLWYGTPTYTDLPPLPTEVTP